MDSLDLLDEQNAYPKSLAEDTTTTTPTTTSQSNQMPAEETNGDDDADSDEAFVALCTDASSVLNSHDPIRRYHINKLYQPLNQESDTPLAEQDDEYLLYQELRFLESATQELTADERQCVQLTKILEDDEGDDELEQQLLAKEDPLDRLHLTTVIEALESFPSSPLIGGGGHLSCQADPLMSQAACATLCGHEADCDDQDKPDSTGHEDLSPASTDSGRGASVKEQHDDETTTTTERDSASGGGKYKRRTANARERIRMREINQAFEKLKRVVPIELIQQATSGDESDQTSGGGRRGGKTSSNNGADSLKLTKITTLRLAKSYIEQLSEILQQHPAGDTPTMPDNGASMLANDKHAASGGGGDKQARSACKRKRRRNSSVSKKVAISAEQSPLVTSQQQVQLVAIPKITHEHDKKSSPAPIVSANQHQPILITNNVLSGCPQTTTNTLIPIQQHQPQQFTYARCNQQPLTISHSNNNHNSNSNNNNGQDRTFVTPVAVAILGIPTGATNQRLNELQLLGIQSSHQHQQQVQVQQAQVQRQYTIQTNPAPTYNLIAQQSQPVTFTLDDINGLSVLRLANHQLPQQATVQLQQAGRTIIQQPQAIATTTTGYNYATYQPVHISQVQSANMTTFRPLAQQQEQQQQQQHSIGDSNRLVQQQQSVTTTVITGTKNSESRTFGLSPNVLTQNLNDNTSRSNVVQATQINIHRSNSSAGNTNRHLLTVPANAQLYQAPTTISNGPFEQVKFVAQYTKSGAHDKDSNEANIRQLVASLTTSIHPEKEISDADDTAKGQQPQQQQQQQQPHQQEQQQQQAKRTYRFHNYDGNMITNHLYNTSQDKNPSSQAANQKRNHNQQQQQQQQQQASGQRSRQNSLSSTCSTTSSASSSLTALLRANAS